jgi:5'-3' exonuclease
MGVPKFFRWMSERYPGISQLIAENRIPEFDCLYVRLSINCSPDVTLTHYAARHERYHPQLHAQ